MAFGFSGFSRFVPRLPSRTDELILGIHHELKQFRKEVMTALTDLQNAEADEEDILNALLADHDKELADLAVLQAQLASQDNPAASDIEAIVTKMKAAQDAARSHLAGEQPAEPTA